MTNKHNDISSLIDATGEWAASAADRLNLSVKLAIAEARLALLSLILMVIIGVLIALTIFAAWSLLVVIIGLSLFNLGFNLVSVCLLLVVLHIVLVGLLTVAMTRVSKSLEFRATRKRLVSKQPQEGVAV